MEPPKRELTIPTLLSLLLNSKRNILGLRSLPPVMAR